MKLNNRGQSLVLFVIFIPILMFICAYVIDIGLTKYNYNKISNIANIVLNYGLKNIDDDPYQDMVELVHKNDEDIKVLNLDIDSEKKEIKIELKKETNSIFGKLINKESYTGLVKYKGYINDEKFVIERDDN